MSDTLLGVLIGAILTGVFLIVAQWMATRAQGNAARAAWDRSQAAQERADLESTCLAILRQTHQIDSAVTGWENGTRQATQAHASINAAARELEDAGLILVLRQGPDDPTAGLIGRVIDEASRFSGLYLQSRTQLATVLEKSAQKDAVGVAAATLRSHLHKMVKSDGPR